VNTMEKCMWQVKTSRTTKSKNFKRRKICIVSFDIFYMNFIKFICVCFTAFHLMIIAVHTSITENILVKH